MITSYLVIWL